ncbi:DNA-binding protein [Brucella anthropi]|nr:DNA-binding protein [Brucella anthropi]
MSAIFSMNEAADRLRIGRRTLQEIIKRHAFYFTVGHKKFFTEKDLDAIVEGLRRETKCHSSSSLPVRANRRTTTFAAPTSGSQWTEVQRRLTKLRQQSSSNSGKKKSKQEFSGNPGSRPS